MRKEVIGNATLYLGDCVEVLKSFSVASIDMIWTDPPYGNDNHSGDFNDALNKHRGIENRPIANDDLASMQIVVDGMLKEAIRIMQEPSSVCCCCCGGGGPTPVFAWLASRLDNDGMSFFHAVVWDKKNPGIGWRYRRQYEFVMVAHKTNGKLAWADDNVMTPNIISLYPPRERSHPNEKPVALVADFIKWHTKPGQIVLDPFMGSGTTGVAALQLGRKFIGIELDPKHFKTAVHRIKEAAKQPGLFT